MKKLTELDKLKFWIDTEFTIIHIMFCVIMIVLTKGWFWTFFFAGYIGLALFYIIVRLAVIAADDPDYLRSPGNRQ